MTNNGKLLVEPSSENYGSLLSDEADERTTSGFHHYNRNSIGDSLRSSIVGIGTSTRSSIANLGMSTRDGIRNSLVFGGSRVSVRDLGGHSTIAKSSFNLVKNLVGAGVLALPSGV